MSSSGIFHIVEMACVALYAFFIPKHTMADFIYVTLIAIIVLSWILLQNECFVSYIIRKMKDPHYVMGSDPLNMKDLIEIFGPIWVNYYINGVLVCMFLSFYIASIRSKLLSETLASFFIVGSILYLASIHHFSETKLYLNYGCRLILYFALYLHSLFLCAYIKCTQPSLDHSTCDDIIHQSKYW